ncbi:MAG: tRNA (adenosine(37)-N6)-threonylcarbamoyltransferase complex ATPase subunit type 1 TsaE [Gammaproteobacteria bacterium]|nr:tRNA (adenosine(37)-N6)-threonylcarbamoyltransferase complex ATPase subunit type 1 TsaE [Gammaproteobacteria bacterium]NNM14436.1 tRNA (adenosine(37)-N6)-threonylcarbamoyltransferase complex ATPase subunit type 1 TsaE [Gammaproteobacteria bacterium]
MHAEIHLKDEQATVAFGNTLAAALRANFKAPANKSVLITLEGDLGAGKTTLVRATLRALGVTGAIKSPTYTLLEPYSVPLNSAENKSECLKIAHLDLYRLQEPEELEYIGGRDLLQIYNLILVEWPDKAKGYLAKAHIKIQLNHRDKGRQLILQSTEFESDRVLKMFKNS